MTNKRSKNDPKMIQIDPKTIQKLWLWINPTCLRDDIFSLVYAEPETWDGSAPRDSVQTNPDTSSLNTWQPLHAYIKKYIDQELPYLMRQICVLQWVEIKTKNSGAMHLREKGPRGGKGKLILRSCILCVHIETSSLWAEFVNKNRCISVRLVSEEVKSIKFDNFDNSHNSFLWPEYFIDFLCERWIQCQAVHYRTETVNCSTKDAYTYEITFLALHPWSD